MCVDRNMYRCGCSTLTNLSDADITYLLSFRMSFDFVVVNKFLNGGSLPSLEIPKPTMGPRGALRNLLVFYQLHIARHLLNSVLRLRALQR